MQIHQMVIFKPLAPMIPISFEGIVTISRVIGAKRELVQKSFSIVYKKNSYTSNFFVKAGIKYFNLNINYDIMACD